MTKMNVTILGVEDTKDGVPRMTGANKPYARVNTDQGWMSCFNPDLWATLRNHLNAVVSVDVKTKGAFTNLMELYGSAEVTGEDDMDQSITHEKPTAYALPRNKVPLETKVNGKNTMFLTSYAKDIFVALVVQGLVLTEDLAEAMESAVNLVKQAQDSF